VVPASAEFGLVALDREEQGVLPAQFFELAMGAGLFPKGDNPAIGPIKFGAREKATRRKFGSHAFTDERVKVIDSAKPLPSLPKKAR
jgi:hypothetical protein